jgi:hypothetical protein
MSATSLAIQRANIVLHMGVVATKNATFGACRGGWSNALSVGLRMGTSGHTNNITMRSTEK